MNKARNMIIVSKIVKRGRLFFFDFYFAPFPKREPLPVPLNRFLNQTLILTKPVE